MSQQARLWAWQLKGLLHSHKILMLGLAEFYDDNQGHVCESIHTLAKFCGFKKQKFNEMIDDLIGLNLLIREENSKQHNEDPTYIYKFNHLWGESHE